MFASSVSARCDGIDVRLPVLIVVGLGLAGGAVLGRGGLDISRAPTADAITGTASVLDGDTIEIHGVRIRLEGIDAPESRQTCRAGELLVRCGQDAAFHLSSRIGRRPVSCEPQGTDRYGRTLAVCFEGGEDLNAFMVRNGQAVAYRAFSRRYVREEDDARDAGPGHLGDGV